MDIFDQIHAQATGGTATAPAPTGDIFDQIHAQVTTPDWRAQAAQATQQRNLSPLNPADAQTIRAIYDAQRANATSTPLPNYQAQAAQQQQQNQQLENAGHGDLASAAIEFFHPAGQVMAATESALAPAVGMVLPDMAANMRQNAQQLQDVRGNGGIGSTVGQVAGSLPIMLNPLVAGTVAGGETYHQIKQQKAAGADIGTGSEATHVIGSGLLNAVLSKLFGGKAMGGMESAIAAKLAPQIPQMIARYGAKGALGALTARGQRFLDEELAQHTTNPNIDPFADAINTSDIAGGAVNVGMGALHEGVPALRDYLNRPEPQKPQPVTEIPLAPVAPEVPAPATESRPPLTAKPGETNEQLRTRAIESGYDPDTLQDKGRRPLLTELDRQRLIQEAPKSARIAATSETEDLKHQAQLPPEGVSWDAGQLNKFARDQGYSIDRRRVSIDVERGVAPRDAIRTQIEEQYSKPAGQGPLGKVESAQEIATRATLAKSAEEQPPIPVERGSYLLKGDEASPAPKAALRPTDFPPELSDAKAVGEFARTKLGEANSGIIESLAGQTPGKFVLRDVPINSLEANDLAGDETNPAKVAKYAAQPAETRPPVIAGKDGIIFDGGHRLAAAKANGEKTIKAYVPESFGETEKPIADMPEPPKTSTKLSRESSRFPRLPGESDAQYAERVDLTNEAQVEVESENDIANRPVESMPPEPSWAKDLIDRFIGNEEGGSQVIPRVKELLHKQVAEKPVEEPIKNREIGPKLNGEKPKLPQASAPKTPTASAFQARASIRNNPLPGNVVHESRVPRSLEELGTPLTSRVRDISPAIYGDLMRTLEQEPMQKTAEQKARMLPALHTIEEAVGKPGSDTFEAFKAAWHNEGRAAVRELLPPEARPALDTIGAILDESHAAQKAAGVDTGFREDYLPSAVKDHAAWLKAVGKDKLGVIEDAWQKAEKTKGSPLTDSERRDVTNLVEQGYGPRKPGAGKMTFSKQRVREQLTPEQLATYENPLHAVFRYVDAANKATARAKFLGKGSNESNLMESIGAKIKAEIDAGRLSADKQNELTSLLHTRLSADAMHMGGIAKTIKDTIYATTLTHMWSGLNQLTDIATMVRRHGVKATVGGLKDALRITPRDSRLVANEMGIDHKTGEFRDPGKLDKLLHYATKLNAFQKIDVFTKEAELNAAVRRVMSDAKAPDSTSFKRLQRDWEPVLGTERFASAMEAARKGDLTNAGLRELAFNKLTEVQPITQSNMPEKYLKMKDGRILYTLHTFALQQLDSIRRDTVRKLATSGQRTEGIKNLAVLTAYGAMAGVTKGMMTDLMQGKPIENTPEWLRVGEALLNIVGLNRYTAGSAAGHPFKTLIDLVAPPVSQFDAPFQDITTAGDKKGLESVRLFPVPYINDLLYYHAGRGSVRTYQQSLDHLHDAAKAAYLDRDRGAARNYVRLYNDFQKNAPEGIAKRKAPLTIEDFHEPSRPK